jgi:hypothetical protein
MGQGFSSGLVSNWDTEDLRGQLEECRAGQAVTEEGNKNANRNAPEEPEKVEEVEKTDMATTIPEEPKEGEKVEEAEKTDMVAEPEKVEEAEKTDMAAPDEDEEAKEAEKTDMARPTESTEEEPVSQTPLTNKLRNGGEQSGGKYNTKSRKRRRTRRHQPKQRATRKSSVGKPTKP